MKTALLRGHILEIFMMFVQDLLFALRVFLLILVIYRLFTFKILNKQTLFAESLTHLILYKLVIGRVSRESMRKLGKSLMSFELLFY